MQSGTSLKEFGDTLEASTKGLSTIKRAEWAGHRAKKVPAGKDQLTGAPPNTQEVLLHKAKSLTPAPITEQFRYLNLGDRAKEKVDKMEGREH